jgi:multidrug resistance efflux pump
MIALAVVAAFTFVDRRATYRERARCNAAAIQSQLNAARADLSIAKNAADEARQNASELETQKTQAENDNARLKAEIDKLPVADRCIITPDRAKRM